jgi:hypothetical protein
LKEPISAPDSWRGFGRDSLESGAVPSRVPPLTQLRLEVPDRPPDWRWRRARALLEAGKRGRRREDRLVVRIVRWLRSTARRPRAYLADWPDLTAARGIHVGNSFDASRVAELQGWLLAGAPDWEVAARFGLTAGTVAAYHDIFFDVRSRLGIPESLVPFFISEQMMVREDESDTWVRVLGLLGGPHVLAAYLEYATQPPPVVPTRLDHLSDEKLERLQARLEIRKLLLTMFPAVSDREQLRWAIALELQTLHRWHGW